MLTKEKSDLGSYKSKAAPLGCQAEYRVRFLLILVLITSVVMDLFQIEDDYALDHVRDAHYSDNVWRVGDNLSHTESSSHSGNEHHHHVSHADLCMMPASRLLFFKVVVSESSTPYKFVYSYAYILKQKRPPKFIA